MFVKIVFLYLVIKPACSFRILPPYLPKYDATKPVQISYRELLNGLEADQFEKITFSPNMRTIIADTKNAQKYETQISPLLTEKVVDIAMKHHTEPVFDLQQQQSNNGFQFIYPFFMAYLLASILRGVLASRNNNNRQNTNMFGGFGGIGGIGGGAGFYKPVDTNITFQDWAGSKEVLEECIEFVSYMKNSTSYDQIGAKMPKGILLEGPPGTGKTLLAKAIATESASSFISVSGSEFVEMFVGVGAMRIRKLFEEARRMRPCIIFIDEIDAIGKQRGVNPIGGNDEREQTLNQLLTEMDGFYQNEDITIMAATNRIDILDKALLRPGRFDRIIQIPLPDLDSRVEMIALFLKDKLIDETVDFRTIAKMTSGYSGADLQNLINEATIIAARNKKLVITGVFLEEAIEKSAIGIKKAIDTRDIATRRRVAIHEIGHAFICNFFGEYFDLQKVSIQSSYSGVGGFTLFSDNFNISESRLYTKDFLIKRLMVSLGGKAAESVYYGDEFVSLGASMDLVQANGLATEMIERYGMGNKLIVFSRDTEYGKSYSEVTKMMIDREVAKLVNEAYASAVALLLKEKPLIDKYVDALLENTVLSVGEFRDIAMLQNVSEEYRDIWAENRSGMKHKSSEFDIYDHLS